MASTARSARPRARSKRGRSIAGEVEAVDPGPPAGQPPAGDPAVGAVVALAADDHDPAAVGPPEEAPGAPGDGSAGPVDERRFADPAGDGGGIPGGHLGRCEDWEHLTQWYGPTEPRSVDRRATDGIRSDCKVISAPTGVAGGDNVGSARGPGRLRAATRLLGLTLLAPGLRRRLPVGRHHGQDARAGDDDHHGVDHHDDGRGRRRLRRRAQSPACHRRPARPPKPPPPPPAASAAATPVPLPGDSPLTGIGVGGYAHRPPGPGGQDRQRRRRPAPGRASTRPTSSSRRGRGRLHPLRRRLPLHAGRPGGPDPLGPLHRHRPAGPAVPPAVLVLRRQPRLQEAGPGVGDGRRRRRELPRQVLPGQQGPQGAPQPLLQHLGARTAWPPPTPRHRRRCSPTGAPATRPSEPERPAGVAGVGATGPTRARPGPTSATTGTRAPTAGPASRTARSTSTPPAGRSPRPT